MAGCVPPRVEINAVETVRGKVLSVDFNETRDGGYNKKLREQLGRIRFRPAVKRDGTPIRATAQIEYDM